MNASRQPAERTGRQQLQQLWAELSERDVSIISSVAELTLATTRQIQRLHFPVGEHTQLGAIRSTNRTLERLTKQRLLIRLERSIGGVRAGSSAHTFALGPVGSGLIRRDQPRRRFREPGVSFVRHRLAVTELFVCLVEATADEQIELLSYETEPRCWRRYTSQSGETVTLKPDLRVALGVDRYELHWFIEVDLGTEHVSALLRKCHQYEAAFRSGLEQRQIGLFPRVIFVMSEAKRVATLQRALQQARDLSSELFIVSQTDEAIATLAAAPESPQ